MNDNQGNHPDLRRIAMVGLALLGALLMGGLTVALAQEPIVGEPLPDTLHLGMPPSSMGTAPVGTSPMGAASVSSLPADPRLGPPAAPITLPTSVWRLGVVTDGLYALDYATLAVAGVPVTTTDPMSLHLSWRGQSVSLDRSDLEDGTWDPGDALVFYGEKFHGSTQDEKYTDENVYWLSVATDTVPSTMATRSVVPTAAPAAVGCTVTTGLEENNVYWARHTRNPGTWTTWFWKKMPAAQALTETLTLPVEAPVTNRGGTLVVEVAPRSSTGHDMRLALNGTLLDSWSWWGKIGRVVTVTVPAGVLQDGNNTVGIFLDELPSTVYLDRIELTYVREPGAVDGTARCRVPVTANATYTFTGTAADAAVYDVTDPLNPVHLEGAQASAGQLVFSDDAAVGTRYIAEPLRLATLAPYEPDLTLINPAEGADELIIAPAYFRTALQPLIDHREGQGLRVKFAAVEDVYPLFNGGIFHPEAIRGLVGYAYHHWPGDPLQYLFLVGDGHFNFKGYNPMTYGAYTPVWVPPYMAFEDPDQGEVPVDARFGDILTETIDSATGYLLPEIAVGRIPAQDVAQVEGYVAKVIKYESAPPQVWNSQALLVADNGKIYDEGFDGILENLKNQYFGEYLAVDTVYMDDYCPIDPNDPYADCFTATQALTESWNAGASLLVYAGHGSVNRWAHEPLLYNTQLTGLTQTDELPFLLSMDCWDGNWFFPPSYPGVYDTRSIGEWVTTVLTETGAIATFSPAALAYSGLEEKIAQGIFTTIFDQDERHLGPITQAGRERLGNSYLARTYTLLGDPATQLNIRRAANLSVHLEVTPALVLAGDALTYTLAFSHTGEFAASEASIAFPLPSWLTDTAYSYSKSYSGAFTLVQGERYAWNIGTITPGGRGMITVTAQVKPDLTIFGPIMQEVEIRTQTPEANPANNLGQTVVGLAFYEIEASPQIQTGGGLRGDQVKFPIMITNRGYPTNTVALIAVDNSWPTSITPSSVMVPSLASRTVTATVTIPTNVTPTQTDTVSIQAVGTGSSAEAQLVTEVYHGVYLPLVTR